MSSFWITWMGSRSNDKGSYKKIQEKTQKQIGGRDWSYAEYSTSHPKMCLSGQWIILS